MTRSEIVKKDKEIRKKRTLRNVRIFISTFIMSIVLICSIGWALIRFGVFPEIRKLMVETSLTTLNHKYIARLFASQDEIKSIMDSSIIDDTFANADQNIIHPTKEHLHDIQLKQIKGATYKGYILEVKDPSTVDVGVCTDLGSSGMKVEDIVKQNGAVAGVNAGGFDDPGGKGNGGMPVGLLIKNHKILYMDDSSTHSIIGMNDNNILVIGNYTTNQVKKMNMRCAVTFRPFLVINGQPTIKSGNGGWGIAPRTAIGQKKDGTILLLAIDGRQISSVGATLKDVQDIMLDYGAINAANLDGGSSTTLVYNDKIVNNPCSQYGPRYVPTAFIVK